MNSRPVGGWTSETLSYPTDMNTTQRIKNSYKDEFGSGLESSRFL
jgi:hypothetical protein